MKYLHLDKKFNPIGLHLNEIKYESFTFKGGEPHIKIEQGNLNERFPDNDTVTITHRINSFNDLGLLMVAVNALRKIKSDIKLKLVLPYFPGARQDRVMVEGEPLTVKVYTDTINSLEFSKVTILDPHSDVTPALLNNVQVIDNHKFVLSVLRDIYPKRNSHPPILISPDAGSNKKIKDLGMYLSNFNVMDIVKCDKSRNVKTGEITDFVVYIDDLKGRDVIIVDDICDGGGTFLGLGQKLKEKGAGKMYLVVTHGIFSQGFKNLNEMFEMVYTTDSIKNYDKQYVSDHKHHKGFVPKIKEIKIKTLL